MKVYYIGNRYDGCYYVRCLLPLQAGGWDGDRTSLFSKQCSPEQMLKGALNADVVVFQRPDDDARLKTIPLLKQLGKKIVFDNDDTYIPDSGVPTTMQWGQGKQILEKMNINLMEFAKQADMVTTTTEFLAEEYKNYNDNVVVLPNSIDPDHWDKPKRNKGDKVRIGFVGSVVSNSDSRGIMDILKYLNDRDDVQIVVFGLPSKELDLARKVYKEDIEFWESVNIEWQPFVPLNEYAETLNNLELDIMLIPRDDSYFNRAKSNIKFLEASMLEIPVIAQGFKDGKSPYQGKEDSQHLRIAKTTEEWIMHIEDLMDKKTRREQGKEARKYVIKNYNINKTIKLWQKAYKKLCEQ